MEGDEGRYCTLGRRVEECWGGGGEERSSNEEKREEMREEKPGVRVKGGWSR